MLESKVSKLLLKNLRVKNKNPLLLDSLIRKLSNLSGAEVGVEIYKFRD